MAAPTMRNVIAIALIGILLLPLASASDVTFSELTPLSSQNLDLNAADVSPDGNTVLVVGSDGFVHAISADEPGEREKDISIDSSRSASFNDVAWHPNGETALIAGELGAALRYVHSDQTIESLSGATMLNGIELTNVEWRAGGDLAFFGAVNGNVYSFNQGEGITELEGSMNSTVTDIACHIEENICVLATIEDGIGVIDRTRELTWISGTSSQTWMAIDCPVSTVYLCTGFASGRQYLSIRLDIEDASKSTGDLDGDGETEARLLEDGDSDFIKLSRGYDGTTIVHMAPMESVRYEPKINEVFLHTSSEELTSFNPTVAGESITLIWEKGENDGWMLTTTGKIVKITPDDTTPSLGIMETIVFTAVAISVPGVIIGLIYMNSPFLQRKYRQLRGFDKKS
jgi:hypothetical protein|tara:strand:+ start:8253 stop:9455 length:1203 start_codon:yes stop_codon:yes gene_type:complete